MPLVQQVTLAQLAQSVRPESQVPLARLDLQARRGPQVSPGLPVRQVPQVQLEARVPQVPPVPQALLVRQVPQVQLAHRAVWLTSPISLP